MIKFILLVISFLLDGILTNFLPCFPNSLSYFTPLLTVVSILLVYPFYRKDSKSYFVHMFLLGIFYDLFYTNLLFWDAILFLGIAYVSSYLYKNFEVGFVNLIFLVSIIVILYESWTAIIIFLFQLVPITFSKLVYKIVHSLLLNIFYIQFFYLILKIIPNKYKKISIN